MAIPDGETAANYRRRLVVAGNGMVGHKLLELLVERGATAEWDIVTFCEEGRPAYDRVGLSSFFNGTSAEELSLVAPGFFDQLGVQIHLGDAVASIDREACEVVSTQGKRIHYDALVLATGSYPFVPPVPGKDLPGCFVYRTLDDLEAIREYAAGCRVGAVVGGGPRGGQRPAQPGPRNPRGRVRRPAHAGAGGRRRRVGPAPADRGAGRGRPHGHGHHRSRRR